MDILYVGVETFILFERNLVKLHCCFYNQGHAADVFEAYSQLLTEMVLRLPYQIKKIADTNPRIPPPVFDHSWFYYLSEVSCCVLVIFIHTPFFFHPTFSAFCEQYKWNNFSVSCLFSI